MRSVEGGGIGSGWRGGGGGGGGRGEEGCLGATGAAGAEVEEDIVRSQGAAGGAGRWWADRPNVRYVMRYADALKEYAGVRRSAKGAQCVCDGALDLLGPVRGALEGRTETRRCW